MNLNPNEVVTGEVRLSYINLFTPKAPQGGGDPKYSATLLIPKTDAATYQRILAAIEAATQSGVASKWNGQRPPMIPNPLHDGDGPRPSDGMEYGPECKGHWVLTASSNQDRPPQVVDAQRNPILNQAMIYSGAYAHVYINFYAYNAGGKKGIGCGLNAVQKTRDGEALGGMAKDANDVFSALPVQAPQTAYAPAQQAQAAYTQQAQAAYTQQVQAAYTQQIDPITGQPIIPPLGM